ncbi:MAG: hypothetical protein SOT67_01290, partial [Bacteroidaceae bacterium]|nr:hypothetical protein [Prevotellaceae bacterium]MDY2848889.1 hypothetical protein [Bacteroidaceae bacterium]
PLRPFLTTFEEQQKKHFFYHIINNMAQIYEYQDIDAHVILLFVHPAPNWVKQYIAEILSFAHAKFFSHPHHSTQHARKHKTAARYVRTAGQRRQMLCLSDPAAYDETRIKHCKSVWDTQKKRGLCYSVMQRPLFFVL